MHIGAWTSSKEFLDYNKLTYLDQSDLDHAGSSQCLWNYEEGPSENMIW